MTAEEKIKNYFDDHYLYRTRYAKEADISTNRFSRIINGKTKITADEIARLASVLNITVDELLHYGEEAN